MDDSSAMVVRPRRFSFDTATTWALVLTLALSAIAFIPASVVPFIPFLYTKVTILALGGLVALILFVLARLTRGSVILPPLALLGALWLVPLAYALSTLFSGVSASTAFFGSEFGPDTFGFVIILAGLASLTALSFRRTSQYRTFFGVLGIAYTLVLAAQLFFVFVGRIAPSIAAPTTNLIGTFPDLGIIVGLGTVIILLALRLADMPNRMRVILYVLGGISLFVTALVNSPTIWMLIGLVALALFIEAIMRHRASSPDESDMDGVAMLLADNEGETAGTQSRSLVAPLVTLAVALFFVIGGNSIGNALVASFGANVIDVRPSWQSTFEVGNHTYTSSPLFGSGPGTFGEQWLKFRDRSINDTVFWSVDFTSGIGSIPTSMVTTGMVGALAWLAFIALFLFIGVRALLFRLPKDSFMRFVAVSSFVGGLYVLVLAIFTVPGPVALAAGFLFIGLFASSLRHAVRSREWGIVFSRNPRVGFIIVFGLTLLLLASILAAYVVTERYLASIAQVEGAQALAAGDLDRAESAISRSIVFAPTDRAYQLAAGVGIARMNQIAQDSARPPAEAQQAFQTALSGSIQAALTATDIGPNNYQNWAMLGNVYQVVVPLRIEGAYDNAKTAYERAISLNPTSPVLPFVVAQLEIAQGNAAAAEERLVQAINLKRDYTQAIFLLSQLEVQQGRAREALEAAEAAAYFAPNDPVILFQVGILRSANGDTNGAVTALSRAVEANPQYANARFFLGVMLAIQGKHAEAASQLEAIAVLSEENAAAVAEDLAALRAGQNPFPPSRLGALGIPVPDVTP
ncbi:MAG TPA: tetratricopeptide repeat protein [Candidatus Paceibacterota bacterium]|nr:tetratricopeptide repeat protein [Candidatus Paceibacterota bacterium]